MPKMRVRSCEICGRAFQTPKAAQRYCSVGCRSASQRRPRAAAGVGSVAVAMVRAWSPARRARIRALSLDLGEPGLTELIDQFEWTDGR